MKQKKVLEIIEGNQPIERVELFKLLKSGEEKFTKGAFKKHIARLKASHTIIENFHGIMIWKSFFDFIYKNLNNEVKNDGNTTKK